MIPRQIFVLWHDATPPVLVRRCIEAMRRFSDCHVRQLSFAAALQLLGIAEFPHAFATPSTRSDFLRAHLLARFGGVYLDASCVVLKPLSTWIDFESDDAHIFGTPTDDAIPEAWAVAAPLGHPLVSSWCDEIRTVERVGRDAYFRRAPRPVARYRTKYFQLSAALDVALKKTGDSVRMLSSSDEQGPLMYRFVDPKMFPFENLLAMSEDDVMRMHFVKLTADERDEMLHHPKLLRESALHARMPCASTRKRPRPLCSTTSIASS